MSLLSADVVLLRERTGGYDPPPASYVSSPALLSPSSLLEGFFFYFPLPPIEI